MNQQSTQETLPFVHYALIQHDDGRTILNSKAGKNLHFRQGNVDKMLIDAAGNVEAKGNLVAGNVKIGSQGHGNTWQGISNKYNAKRNHYALIQNDNGTFKKMGGVTKWEDDYEENFITSFFCIVCLPLIIESFLITPVIHPTISKLLLCL